MATGSTSEIDAAAANKYFASAVTAAKIFTTEISQVPLSGVAALLTVANDSDVLSVLDIDVQPSVATNEAGLGSTTDIIDCVKQARVLKPAKHAAQELMEILAPEIRTELASMSAGELSRRLRDAAECDLVALTDGGNGCALVTADADVTVPVVSQITVTDATGAGDAFLGGLVAGIYFEGLPKDKTAMLRLGELANATGAACCQAIGGLPTDSSAEVLAGLLSGTTAAAYSDHILPLGADISASVTDSEEDTASDYVLAGFTSALANDSATLGQLAGTVNLSAVEKAMTTILGSSGRVLTTGLGKSGMVARRLAVSLASTGTPAHYVHASEWGHGDLGNCQENDVIIALSHSGTTIECVDAIPRLRARDATVISITSDADSAMARASDIAINYKTPTGMGMCHTELVLSLILKAPFKKSR